jgi:hypothetical protein
MKPANTCDLIVVLLAKVIENVETSVAHLAILGGACLLAKRLVNDHHNTVRFEVML